MKKIADLHSLFVDELKDAYDFEHQILDALPRMAESAHDPDLAQGFRRHLEQTRGQVARLEEVFAGLGEEPQRKACKGMAGLLREGREILRARGDEAAVDAALIGAAQRVEHYEMAAYGTLRSFARTLGREQEAAILEEILEQEAATDEKLSQLAERSVNPRAANGDVRREGARRSAGGGDGVRRSRATSRGTGGEATKEELYRLAQELDIPGRSSMSKPQLQRAIARHG